MFEYQSAYKRNASGLHGKTFWSTVLTFILIYVALIVVALLLISPAAFFDSAWVLLWIFPMIFVILLISVFVIYPVGIGVLRFFASAYRQKEYKFKDVFITFQKGNYSKVIKLSLLMLLIHFGFSLIYGFLVQFIVMAINTPLIAIGEGMSSGTGQPSGGEIGLIISLVLLNVLVIVISYIPYILMGIYMFLAFMAYIDQPMIATLDKFRIAWDVMFKAGGGLIRLIVSNFLLMLLPTVLYVLMFVGIAIFAIAVDNEQTLGYMMIILVPLAALIIIALFCYVMYYMTGSLTAYYFECRDALDRRYSESPQNPVRADGYESSEEAQRYDEDDGLRQL
ncbi:hypothetical protein [Salinicoccus carnicancri]|uniref:hypothetical protein n=1 Tax=Salinicoccus carnicancri TaxID=558170 RepID=UPI000316EC3A|nr:hypothetical protein [Salinicoccus carnicancri]